MKTSPRSNPAARSIELSSWPARPTKGSPCRSSSAPGASPITMSRAARLPTPNTVCVRVSHSPQSLQSRTVAASEFQSGDSGWGGTTARVDVGARERRT
jgi:hypothetical protein